MHPVNTSVAESSSESEDDAVEEYQGIDCPLHPSEETEEVTSPESSRTSVGSNNIRRSTRKGRGCNMRQLLEAERTPINSPNPQKKANKTRSNIIVDRALGKTQDKDQFNMNMITVEKVRSFIAGSEMTAEEKQIYSDLNMKVTKSLYFVLSVNLDTVNFARNCLLVYAKRIESQKSSENVAGNESSFIDAFNSFKETRDASVNDSKLDKCDVKRIIAESNNNTKR